MKNILFVVALFITFFCWSQKQMPNISINSIDNKTVNVLNDFNEIDKIYIYTFWATWCAPCINELEAINDNLEKWKKEIDIEIIAISIDDSRTQKRVKPLLNGKNWNFTILLDTNQDLKRALGIANIPFTAVVKNQKILYISNGYSEGSENEMFAKIKQSENK